MPDSNRHLLTLGLAAFLWGCAGASGKSSEPTDAPSDAQAPTATQTSTDAPSSTDAQVAPDASTDDDSAMAPDRAVSQVVGACDSLAPLGTWQEITPPAVKAGLANKMPADGSGTF